MDEQQVTWRKSSWSGDNGGECVEVAMTEQRAYVRDSKDRDGGAVEFPTAEWQAFIESIKQS